MKILLITQWYKPIKGAVKRMARIAEHLAEKGHEMTVLTGFPSYPTGILPAKYKWKLYALEKDGKAKIIRTYEYPAPNEGVFKRLLNNISFTISATLATIALPKQDVVIVTSPSFLSGIPGICAKKISQAKFIFDVRDLWPDSAIELGFVKGKLMIKLLKYLERLYYRKADKITVVTPSIREHLIKEGVPANKVKLLLNSADTSFFAPKKVAREKYGLSGDDFIIVYAGMHGPAQDLKPFIKAGEFLKNYPKIKLLLVGEGEEKENLIRMSRKLKLNKVIFWEAKEPKEIAKIINFSDVGFLSLARKKVFQEAMPTKASEFLSCGKPTIATVQGALKKYLEDYQAGYGIKNEAKTIAKAILNLYRNKPLTTKMSQNARLLALEIFSDKAFFQTLDRALKLKD